MIKKLILENFRLFSNIEIKPKRINIIVGKNNTGKTTILEAISIYQNKIDIDKIRTTIKKGKRRSKITIYEDNKKHKIEIFKDEKILLDEINRIVREINENFKKVEKKMNEDILKTKITIPLINELKIFNTLRKDHIIIKKDEKTNVFFNIEKFILYLIKNIDLKKGENININKIKYFNYLNNENKYDIIHPCNKTIFEEELKNNPNLIIELEKIIKKYKLLENFDRLTENYIFLNNKPYSFDLFGEGFKQFMNIVVKTKNKKIVLLDEPTSFMHPGYINPFVDHLIKYSKNKQLFITTHNIDLIEEFLNYYKYEGFEDILFIRTIKKEDNVFIEQYTIDEMIENFEETKLDIRGI